MSGPVDQIRRRIDDLLFERPPTPARLMADMVGSPVDALLYASTGIGLRWIATVASWAAPTRRAQWERCSARWWLP